LFLLAGLSLPLPSWAADLEVVCDGEDCQMSPYSGAALFEISDIKPGIGFFRKLIVENNGEEDCNLVMGTKNEEDPGNLSTVLFTVINNGSESFFGSSETNGQASNDKSLWDLFIAGDINLGTVLAGESVNYYWVITMDPQAGNEFQAARTEFDFDLYFECGEPEEDVPSLVLEKDNDKKGLSLGVGDIVAYTIIIVNNGEGKAFDVYVKDVQPVADYFSYDKNSGYLVCTGESGVSLSASGSNPYYWFLGDMEAGEECVLTYEMEILSTAIPGEHDNLAVAYGQGGDGGTYYSNVVEDPILVGRVMSLSAGVEEEEITASVLGAATALGEVLGAATGSKTFWLGLSFGLILLGSVLKFLRKKND
jgi:hypothetical protein